MAAELHDGDNHQHSINVKPVLQAVGRQAAWSRF